MRLAPHTCQKDHNEHVAEILEDLPPSQRSPQRHKCAACAYERGVQDGYNLGLKRAREAVDLVVRSGQLRPEDAYCPSCGDPHIEGSHSCG